MNKLVVGLLAVASILIPILQAAPASADSDNATEMQFQHKNVLLIESPRVVEVAQPVIINVYNKSGHEPIAGVSVYALKTSDLIIDEETDYASWVSAFESLVINKGVPIGTTGDNGTVTASLSDEGRYILAGIKDSYNPGFSRLSVTSQKENGLNIRNRRSDDINTPVIFTVTERFSDTKVSEVEVYARLIADNGTIPSTLPLPPRLGQVKEKLQFKFKNNNAEADNNSPRVPIKIPWTADNVTVINADPANTNKADEYAKDIQSTGFLLGNTDANGELTYSFTSSGLYVLAAVKDQYSPAFSRISIKNTGQQKLGIEIPKLINTEQQVTVKVFNNSTKEPVEQAGVYYFKSKFKNYFSPEISDNISSAQLTNDSHKIGFLNSEETNDFLLQSAIQPVLIGNTDANGEVQYTFTETGYYTLITMKDDYLPAGTRILIQDNSSLKAREQNKGNNR